MVFPVVMYECESWIIKKAECRRIDAFELWCRRRLLRVPWTARRSNQSILKEISPGCSSEGLMLKLQYFGHLMGRTDSLEKTLMLGKIEGRRRRGQQRMRWLDGITDSWTWVWVDSGSWWGLMCCNPWGRKESDTTEQLNWTESQTRGPTLGTLCVCACPVTWVVPDFFVTPWTPTRLLCPCGSPGKNVGLGCHALLQRTFPTWDRPCVSCVSRVTEDSYCQALSSSRHLSALPLPDSLPFGVRLQQWLLEGHKHSPPAPSRSSASTQPSWRWASFEEGRRRVWEWHLWQHVCDIRFVNKYGSTVCLSVGEWRGLLGNTSLY